MKMGEGSRTWTTLMSLDSAFERAYERRGVVGDDASGLQRGDSLRIHRLYVPFAYRTLVVCVHVVTWDVLPTCWVWAFDSTTHR